LCCLRVLMSCSVADFPVCAFLIRFSLLFWWCSGLSVAHRKSFLPSSKEQIFGFHRLQSRG
jgi:hypothetical protein